MRNRNRRWILVTLLALFTLACSLFNRAEPATEVPPTQAVSEVTPGGEVIQPTEDTQPTPTEAAPITTEGGCTLSAAYVADITIPDDTEFAPEIDFTKTWRIRNTGSCTWEEGTQMVFASGEPLGGPASVAISRTAPNSAVDISIPLVAPETAGTYRSNWQLQAPDGTRYGGIFYTQIVVVAEEATTAPGDEISAPKDFTGTVAFNCSKVDFSWTDAKGESSYRIEGPGGLSASLPADSTAYTWNSPPSGAQNVTLIALKGDGSEIGRITTTVNVICISAISLPDLSIDAITFDRTPVAYLPVHVTVRVKNNGGMDSEGFKLRWWGGKNFSTPSCEWNIGGGLAKGSVVDMECDFIYNSAYGSISSKATVDVENAVDETDESNNDLEKDTPVNNPVKVYDFVEKANVASWNGGPPQTGIPWNGDAGDDRGFARWVTSGNLESGSAIQGKCLETHPKWVDNGWVAGTYTDLYSSYVVQEGDRFRATVGFLQGASAGNVTFKAMIRPSGGSNQWIAQVNDTYGNGFKTIDVDLSPYAGKQADMILRVDAGSSSEQDWACWLSAVIYRYP